jgi:translation elongation factor P/translation initiation factor 5A
MAFHFWVRMHLRTLFSGFHYSVVLDSAHAFRKCILYENAVFSTTSVIGKSYSIMDMSHVVVQECLLDFYILYLEDQGISTNSEYS